MADIKLKQFKYFEQIQEHISKSISLIPIGLEYKKLYKFHNYKWFFPTLGNFTIHNHKLYFPKVFPRNKVTIRIGEPRYFGEMPIEKLVEKISDDIRKLSNI